MDDLRKKGLMVIKDKDELNNDTQEQEEILEETEDEVCAACMIRYSNEK